MASGAQASTDPAADVLRILIADDHAVTRSGIRILAELEGSIEVVAEAATGAEAVRLCDEVEPDLVLMDLQMPEMGGVEAIGVLRERHPDLPILVLTVHEDEDAVFEAIRAGATGYLPKSASTAEVHEALHAIRDGQTYMPPAIAGLAIRSLSRHIDESGRASKSSGLLTDRETEVLQLLATGLSARNIGGTLGISERTVNTHIGHVYRKLDVNNRVDAIVAGMRLGIVDAPA